MTIQCMTQKPEPAVPGQKVKICYSCTRPTTLTMSFTPSTIPDQIQEVPLSGDGCVEFDLPDNAVGALVEDDNGVSDDFALLIE